MFDDLLNNKPRSKPSEANTSSAMVKNWAKHHWHLPEDTTLLVSELQCGETNCPDIETVIAVLAVEGTDKTVKLHKPIYAINEADIKSINIWRDN